LKTLEIYSGKYTAKTIAMLQVLRTKVGLHAHRKKVSIHKCKLYSDNALYLLQIQGVTKHRTIFKSL